ncbi:MAG: hypothetical protein QW179_01180 [Candidatus Hadarchaeales archaeon]
MPKAVKMGIGGKNSLTILCPTYPIEPRVLNAIIRPIVMFEIPNALPEIVAEAPTAMTIIVATPK